MAPVEPDSKDLRVLQIDRSQKDALDQKDKGNRGPFLYVVLGVVLLAGAGLALSRILGNAAEVEVGRPALEQGAAEGNVVLTAGGYIVAHHPIDVIAPQTVDVADLHRRQRATADPIADRLRGELELLSHLLDREQLMIGHDDRAPPEGERHNEGSSLGVSAPPRTGRRRPMFVTIRATTVIR